VFKERLKVRKVTGTQAVLSEKANMQVLLARADVMVRTAELVLHTLAGQVHELARNGQVGDIGARMGIVAQNAYASHLARDAVRLIVDNLGSSVHYLSDPMQRTVRDVNLACAHLIQDFESLAEQHGRNMLGLPPITPFF
jgi:hypothetical protein